MATLIHDATELQNMNLDLAGDYELANNIDATATAGWNGGLGFLPVGTFGARFTGTFDGKGFTITGLHINRHAGDPQHNYSGLFGYADGATFSNVTLAAPNVSLNYYCSIFCGVAENCTFQDISISGTFSADSYMAGPLMGEGRDVIVRRCSSSTAVTALGYHVGGLIGWFHSFSAANTIEDCSATGNVVSDDYEVGGLIGAMTNTTMRRCTATGNVTLVAPESYWYTYGGLVGRIRGGCTVEQSYATGNVTGGDEVGSFTGHIDGGTTVNDCYGLGNVTANGSGGFAWAGGFSAVIDGTVNRCYSKGAVTSALAEHGGFCFDFGGAANDCFWDTQTSGQTASACGTGKTTSEMKTLATFYDAGWDIESSSTDRADGYPYLAWQSVWLLFLAPTPPPPQISVVTLPATEIR